MTSSNLTICPKCAEQIQPSAIVCRFCGTKIQKKRSFGNIIGIFGAVIVGLIMVTQLATPEHTKLPTESSVQPNIARDSETFNERMTRQKRYIPALGRSILPAPEGNALEVASAAIKEADLDCTKVTHAVRLDGDGSIIAKCGESDFRIFKVEGTATAMPLSCNVGRDTFGVDACDSKLAGTLKDDSIERILLSLAKL